MNSEVIRVFCPTHEASFTVPRGAKITCEITGHSLSIGFPTSEIWEFCCNCDTFSPSRMEKGAKAGAMCVNCSNRITRRVLCGSCKTLSFECDSHAKGQYFRVSDQGTTPECPACDAVPEQTGYISHQCKEIETELHISGGMCPFCLESVTSSTESGADVDVATCPTCGTPVRIGASFCSQCRHVFGSPTVAGPSPSSVSLTPLMGNLCPTCSTALPSGSSFCGECGQSIIVPPPPPRASAAATPSPAFTGDLTTSSSLAPQPSLTGGKVLAGLGVLLIAAVIFGFVANAPKQSSGSSNTNRNTPIPTLPASNSYAVTDTALTSVFERGYQGTIGGQSFSMTLRRDGGIVTGTAATVAKSDTLSGTIRNDGQFEVDGREFGSDQVTGKYSGMIEPNGRITGYWTLPNGGKPTRLDVSQQSR